MKAVCGYGIRDVRVLDVPEPRILNPRDAIIEVTSTTICGSDLHIYDGYIPTMRQGDIMGHEFMGRVVEVGSEVSNLNVGDRVVVPFTISCGECYYCRHEMYSLCDNSNPNGWMAELRGELSAAGVAAERVHWESFGSTAPSQTEAGRLAPSCELGEVEQALAVRFEHSQVDAAWSDPQQSLWELARQHNVDLPSGCLSGVCGCCRVKLLEGEVVYDRPVSVELAEDECLTCVARPKTACRLDA